MHILNVCVVSGSLTFVCLCCMHFLTYYCYLLTWLLFMPFMHFFWLLVCSFASVAGGIFLRVLMFVCVHIYIYMYMYVCMSACMYVCMYVYILLGTCTHMCIYICMYVYVHIMYVCNRWIGR